MNSRSTLAIRCPNCGAIIAVAWDLPEKGTLRCGQCAAAYPVVAGILDLRSDAPRVRERDGERWDLDAFDRGYEQVTDYEDNWEHARRSGIPAIVEAYRFPRIKRWILDTMPIRNGGVYLDLGCGVGMMYFGLRDRHGAIAFRMVGLDVSIPHLMPLARRMRTEGLRSVLPIAGDGENLPFPSASFDGIICSEVLEHILDKEAAVREMARVLKPGGDLFLTTPMRVAVHFWNAVFRLPRLVYRLAKGKGLSPLETAPYDEPVSLAVLRGLLRSAGLGPEELRCVVFLPHESYFQFLPLAVTRWIVRVGGALEERNLLSWLGLHCVVHARKRAST